jgi:hypothetical protein
MIESAERNEPPSIAEAQIGPVEWRHGEPEDVAKATADGVDLPKTQSHWKGGSD